VTGCVTINPSIRIGQHCRVDRLMALAQR